MSASLTDQLRVLVERREALSQDLKELSLNGGNHEPILSEFKEISADFRKLTDTRDALYQDLCNMLRITRYHPKLEWQYFNKFQQDLVPLLLQALKSSGDYTVRSSACSQLGKMAESTERGDESRNSTLPQPTLEVPSHL